MYTIYSYWNADQVRIVLNAIAIIMNGSDYLGLLKAIGVAAIFVAVGTAFVKMRGEETVAYFLMFALFYGTLFVPKATVTIQDVRTPSVYTVANVPLGVALFASQTSHIGKWLTETFETNFTDIEDERFSKTGMAFGSRLVEELQLVQIRTPRLNQSMVAFVKDCINPELVDNPGALDEMVKAPDLWAYIGGSGIFQLNPGRITSFPSGAYACTGPGGAYAVLTEMLNAEAELAAADIGSRLNPEHSLADTIILTQIPAIEASMLNISRTAQEAIKQGMLMNLMRKGQVDVAQLQNNPQATQIAWAVSTAEQSSRVSYAAMAEVAEGALPKLRNAIELIVLAIFPIAMILIVLAGIKAGLALKTYVMAIFWVQLWAPLYAVINFLAAGTTRSDLMAILRSSGGNTLENTSMLANTALADTSMVGLLTISVPIIAFTIVKGSEVGMSGAVSSVMGPAQAAAQRAGDAIGQGNINAGNVSWGNVNTNNASGGNWSSNNNSANNVGANKQDWSSSHGSSSLSNTTTPHGSFQQDGGGNITGMQANAWSAGGVAGGGTSFGRSDMDTSSTGVRASSSRSSSLDMSSSATSGDSSRAEFSRQFSRALSTRIGESGQSSQRWEAGTSGSHQTAQGGEGRLTNQESFAWGSGASANANVGARQSYGGGGGQGGQQQQGAQPSASPAAGQSGNTYDQSGNSVPAVQGQNAGGTTAGPVTGSRSGSLGLNTGMSVQTAQSVIDAATNRSGSVDQKTQQEAAQLVQAAVSDVMQNTNDAGVRSAAQAFSSDFQSAVRASEQSSASVSKESFAGNSQQQGTSNQVGGSFSMGKPVAEQLLSMAKSELGPGASTAQVAERALQLAANPGAVAAATAAAAGEMKQSPAGNAMISAGGAQAPATPDAVEAKGNADVSSLAGRGKGAVQSSHASNQASVAGHQAASPTSEPDTSSAISGYSEKSKAAQGSYESFKADTSISQGASIAANALYQAEQKGSGTVLANTFLAGYGYQSPQDYSNGIQEAAAARPRLADTLQQVHETGKVSPAAMEFIQSEVKAHHDSKE